MTIKLLFPTPVVIEEPSDATQDTLNSIHAELDRCLEQIKNLKDTSVLSDKSIDDEYGTKEDRNLANKKELSSVFTENVIEKYNLELFVKYVTPILMNYIKQTDWTLLSDTTNNGYRIGVRDAWFNITDKTSNHPFHIHAHHTISGVFYHKIENNMGGITFRNPNAMVANHLFPEGPLNPNMMCLNPSKGTLVLFPSWLEHSTERNRTDDTRISLSFNIDILV